MKNDIIDKSVRAKLSKIKIVAMDVDGVLTDGGMYYSPDGEIMKKFNSRDGMAIEILREKGLQIALITGESNNMVLKRAEKLKITDVFLGIRDKVKTAEDLLKKYNLSWENLLYVGDDWLDVELLKKAGFSCAPKDALPWAKEVSDIVLERKGGEGVIGEVLYLIINGT